MVLIAEEKVIPPYEEGRIGLSWSCQETGLCKDSLHLEFCCACIPPLPQIKPSSLQSIGTGGRSGIWHPHEADGRGDILLPISINTQENNLQRAQPGKESGGLWAPLMPQLGEHFVVRLENGEQSCPFSLVSPFLHIL